MQTLSSARRTCMALASAVEGTATVLMPMSRQARWMRRAISPRLAISNFSNISARSRLAALLDDHHNLAILDGGAVLDQDLDQPAGARRGDLIHHLHRLDNEQRLALGHHVAELGDNRGLRLRRE